MNKIIITIISFLFLLQSNVFSCSPCDYLGAEVATKESYKYGRFEMRTKAIGISGAVSSMFSYYNDSYLPDTMWNEIDIEFLGKDPTQFQSNIITGTTPENPAKKMSEEHHELGYNANQEYHDYAFEWTPTYIAWFVDGVEVRRTTKGVNDSKDQLADFDEREMDLRFNMWIANIVSWVGPFDEADLPACAFYDWYKYSAYTPGLGDDGTDFTLTKVDDFDGDRLDSDFWKISNHSFGENLVMFDPWNVDVSNGKMALCLTDKLQTGMDELIQSEITPVSIASSNTQLKLNYNNGQLHFNKHLNANTKIRVFDLNGNINQTITNNKITNSIKLQNLASGIYFVKISDSQTSKIVVR